MKKILLYTSFITTTFFIFLIKTEAKVLSFNNILLLENEDSIIPTEEITCENTSQILEIGQMLFNYIKIIIPILLIVFIMLDLGKAVLAGSADDIKKAQKSALIRFLAAVAIFFLPSVINLILKLAGIESSTCGVS
ncbi:MAG: hypothetical protein WDA21_04175 [Bacilli bacterium]